MSFCTVWSSLSCLSQAFVCFLVVVWVLVTVITPSMVVLFPLLMLPTLAYALWAKRHPVELDMVVRMYGGGFLPYALLVMLCELFLVVVFVLLCFSDQTSDWLNQLQTQKDSNISIRKTVGLFFFLILMAFVVASTTEEAMKYRVLAKVKRHRPDFNHWGGYLVYAVAPALGFSTVENIGYTMNDQLFEKMLLTAVTRIVIATPVHCLTGYMLGIGVVRREVFGEQLTWYRIMAPAVIFHGAFDWFQFLVGAYGEHLNDDWELTGEVVSTSVAVVSLLIFAFYVRREKYKLVTQYHLQGQYDAFLPVVAQAADADADPPQPTTPTTPTTPTPSTPAAPVAPATPVTVHVVELN